MIRITYILFFFFTCLISCTSSFTVVLQKDNTVTVESELPYGLKEKQKFIHSNLITNLDTLDYRLKFQIKNIDSLGNYLPQFPTGLLEFKVKQDSLFIYGTPSNKFENVRWSHLSLLLKSQNKIEIIQSNKKFVSKINDDNSVNIHKTIRQLKKQNKKEVIIIMLIN